MAFPRYKYTLDERMFLLTQYYKQEAEYDKIFYEFHQQFPNSPIPSRQCVHKLHKKFQQHGSLEDAPRSGRPRTARVQENYNLVAQKLIEEPTQSAKRTAVQLDLSRRSMHRIIKEIELKVYQPQLLHSLSEDDFDRRVQFAEWYLIQNDTDPEFFRNILWSDEAIFNLDGSVNRHNCVYWSDNKPNLAMLQEFNLPGVIVWAGVSTRGIIGPYFFETSVNDASYLELLEELRATLNCDPRFTDYPIMLQQDGCPAHYARNVRQYLDENFPGWIGRRGRVEWPARSPDMTVCDFALWGALQEAVFSRRPRSLDELRTFIQEEMDKINNNHVLLFRMCKEVEKRCWKVIEVDGHHFEHLL